MHARSLGLAAGLLATGVFGAVVLASTATAQAAPLECRLIDCDCDHVDAGLLTKAYRKQCRDAESKARESCENGGPQLYCDSVASGDLAFPVNATKPPPVSTWVDQFASGLGEAQEIERVEIYRRIGPYLESLSVYEPALKMVSPFGGPAMDGIEANIDLKTGLSKLQPDGDGLVPPENAHKAARDMVKGTAALDRSGPENPAGLYNLGKSVERFAAAGIAAGELSGGDADVAKTLERAAKWVKLGSDLKGMSDTGEVNAKRFVDDALSLIPKEASPALAGPAGKYFRDLMDYDQKMWKSSTEGLDLVSRAIETGKLDKQAYGRVSGDLQALAAQGPWRAQSGLDFVKKAAEEIPVVGKLLKALWS